MDCGGKRQRDTAFARTMRFLKPKPFRPGESARTHRVFIELEACFYPGNAAAHRAALRGAFTP